jgi:hydroxyacylglutathione hydrolase
MPVFFRQILHQDLGCASYLIAAGGEAVVVDPKWEIADYLEAADAAGASIRHIVETHCHADHVSGRRRLADATGAVVHLPADPADPEPGDLHDGAILSLAGFELRAVGAPGHRPEHLAYLITGRGPGASPPVLLAGDSLLIGGLARPDLAVDPVQGARALFGTVQRLSALEPRTELWPAHVGGSLCGSGAVTDRTSSTIGEELAGNPLLSLTDPEAFVDELTRGTPTRPPRVEQVVALNERGAPPPGPLRELDTAGLAQFIAYGACVLDVRAAGSFDAAHLANAINLPAIGQGLGTRAGWATRPGDSIVVVSPTLESGLAVASLLHAAGVTNVIGVSPADPGAWRAAGLEVRSTVAIAPRELVARLSAGELQLVDVRDLHEWRSGHVSGSLHVPLSELTNGGVAALPHHVPLAVTCARGPRAALAASVLRCRGHREVLRLEGGVGDLAEHGAELAYDAQ